MGVEGGQLGSVALELDRFDREAVDLKFLAENRRFQPLGQARQYFFRDRHRIHLHLADDLDVPEHRSEFRRQRDLLDLHVLGRAEPDILENDGESAQDRHMHRTDRHRLLDVFGGQFFDRRHVGVHRHQLHATDDDRNEHDDPDDDRLQTVQRRLDALLLLQRIDFGALAVAFLLVLAPRCKFVVAAAPLVLDLHRLLALALLLPLDLGFLLLADTRVLFFLALALPRLARLALLLHAFAPLLILRFAPLGFRARLLLPLGTLHGLAGLVFLLAVTLFLFLALAQFRLLLLELGRNLGLHCPQTGQVELRQSALGGSSLFRALLFFALAARLFFTATIGFLTLAPLIFLAAAAIRAFTLDPLVFFTATLVFLFALLAVFLVALPVFLVAQAAFLVFALAALRGLALGGRVFSARARRLVILALAAFVLFAAPAVFLFTPRALLFVLALAALFLVLALAFLFFLAPALFLGADALLFFLSLAFFLFLAFALPVVLELALLVLAVAAFGVFRGFLLLLFELLALGELEGLAFGFKDLRQVALRLRHHVGFDLGFSLGFLAQFQARSFLGFALGLDLRHARAFFPGLLNRLFLLQAFFFLALALGFFLGFRAVCGLALPPLALGVLVDVLARRKRRSEVEVVDIGSACATLDARRSIGEFLYVAARGQIAQGLVHVGVAQLGLGHQIGDSRFSVDQRQNLDKVLRELAGFVLYFQNTFAGLGVDRLIVHLVLSQFPGMRICSNGLPHKRPSCRLRPRGKKETNKASRRRSLDILQIIRPGC